MDVLQWKPQHSVLCCSQLCGHTEHPELLTLLMLPVSAPSLVLGLQADIAMALAQGQLPALNSSCSLC